MQYKVSGKGKAVVLLHGFIEEGSMWNDLVRSLSKKYKVLVPDLPGFGKSPLAEPSKVSMEWYAAQVYDMLQKEKVKKCAMLGHSMGGYITLSFAEKHGDMLTGFGLINSQCYADSDEKKANRKKSIGFIQKHGAKPFVKELYHTIFSEKYIKQNKAFVNSLIAKAELYTVESLCAATAAMMNRSDKSAVLKNAKVPVLLIGGKDDPSAPLDAQLKQAPLATLTDLHIYSECKHMCIFEKKKETFAAINAYLQRL